MDLHSIFPDTGHSDNILKAEKFLDNLLVRTNFTLKTRTALGWRGLHPSVRSGNGWTCKIRGNDGVYGIWLQETRESEKHYQLVYNLAYFPMPEEETRMMFAIETALLPADPQYMDYVRNFMCYPEFTKLFYIAEIHIILQKDNREAIAFSLKAQRRLRTISEEGIYNIHQDEKICLVEPKGVDQDLPAFHLAYPFFEVLGATVTYNLSDAPHSIYTSKAILSSKDPDKEFDEMLEIGLVYQNDEAWFDAELFFDRNLALWFPECEDSRPFNDAPWWTTHLSLSQATGNSGLKAIDRPQLIVLSGFLGSGKTSFLKHFIEYHTQNNRFVAVIQNEIGQKGLDASILEDSFGVMEMDEGCVCCSLAGQLRKGIQQIHQSYNPDVIILETTGLANPFNLLAELEEVKDLIRFDSITTVVDALNINRFMKESHIAEEQIKAADIILVNKIDLIDKQQKEALLEQISSINNNALVLESVKGDINPALIYAADKDEVDLVAPPHSHENHMHEHLGSIKAEITSLPGRGAFEQFIKNLPDGIFRSKGRIAFSDRKEKYVFQYVNGRYELEETVQPEGMEYYLIFIGKNSALEKIDLTQIS